MKKVILTFGLIAGAVLSALMVAMLPFVDDVGFDNGMLLGYTTMVIAFLLIFFGIRSYRDNVAGGSVRFWRAFMVGISIAAIASVCYSAMWHFYSQRYAQDFIPKYQAHVLDKARAGGASEEEIARQRAELEEFARQYENPAFKAAVTFFEPMPVGLVIALVSAGVLSRRRQRRPREDMPPRFAAHT